MIERNIASPRYATDWHSREIISALIASEALLQVVDGVTYYEYPLFRDSDDVLYRSKILFASRSHGIVVFSVPALDDPTCSSESLAAADAELSQLVSIIYSRLLNSRILRRSASRLGIEVAGYIVLPDVTEHSQFRDETYENTLVWSINSIVGNIAETKLEENLSVEQWKELRAILEGSRGLVRIKERVVPSSSAPNSKPVLLRELEAEVANFDINQRRAAISIVDGPQRIRGLAGSGKTIVLAMKVAHLHLNNPDATILFTFYTKSLYGFLKRLVTRFYRQFNDRDPDWSKVQIRHAWGGQSVEGVYYDTCLSAGIRPMSFRDAQGKGVQPFEYVCQELLKSKITARYDYVLIDEAQDVPPTFYRLCFALARGEELDRNVIWAYDELQNIMNVAVRSPRELFGVNTGGIALMDLDRAAAKIADTQDRDIVLQRCYRNPREILVLAHALGFGIYSENIVQMLQGKEHWEDVGYRIESGSCTPGQRVVINRPSENSPLSLSGKQTADELIVAYRAVDFESELRWLANSIQALVTEGLRPEDIMIIVLDDMNARTYAKSIAKLLSEFDISLNDVLSSSTFSVPTFSLEGHVTFSTVYRAKGNEAPVVFAVGIDAIHPKRKLQQGRNMIFTAFTRAKAWLRISGTGERAQYFVDEIARAKTQLPNLVFEYPDPAEVISIQRDLTDRGMKLKKAKLEFQRQLELLDLDDEERELVVEDLKSVKKEL